MFLHSVIFIDWMYCDRRGPENRGLSVCVSVCLSVCVCLCVCLSVCVISTAQTDGSIFIKLSTNNLADIWNASEIFQDFWNFEVDDVMTAIFYLFNPAHSWSQFCFDLLRNSMQDTQLSCVVCYWKSANRSVTSANMADRVCKNNSKWPPKITFLKTGKWGVVYY